MMRHKEGYLKLGRHVYRVVAVPISNKEDFWEALEYLESLVKGQNVEYDIVELRLDREYVALIIRED